MKHIRVKTQVGISAKIVLLCEQLQAGVQEPIMSVSKQLTYIEIK